MTAQCPGTGHLHEPMNVCMLLRRKPVTQACFAPRSERNPLGALTQARRLALHYAEELDAATLRRRILSYDSQRNAVVSESSGGQLSSTAEPDVRPPAQRSKAGSQRQETDVNCAAQLSDIAAQLAVLTQAVHLLGGGHSQHQSHDRVLSR